MTELKPRVIYAWIHQNHGNSSIALCCTVLSVRREGYYEWQKRVDRSQRDLELLSTLKKTKQEHPAYGVKGLVDELNSKGIKASYGKIYKFCRLHNLLQYRRKPKSITKQDPNAFASDDLVKRNFKANEENTKWLTDITEMKLLNGKLYLSAVLDCYDGAIVGMSMANHMRAELCTGTIENAINRFGKTEGLIIHSDRGTQYTSNLFRNKLSKHKLRQSMGRTGTCFDNARMESFFATLKKNLIYKMPLSTMTFEQVRAKIFCWVETYYNRKRRNTANYGNLPPLVKRARRFAIAA